MKTTKFTYARELIRAAKMVGESASRTGSRISPQWLIAAMNAIDSEIAEIESPSGSEWKPAWNNPDGPTAA